MAADQREARMTFLEEKLAGDPDSFYFLPLAQGYLDDGKLDEALATCTEGLKKHSHYTSARALLGLICQMKKMDDKALEELDRVVEEDPFNLLAHRLLGEIYVAGGDLSRGKAAFRKALAICPRDEEAAQARKGLEEDPGREEMTAERGEAFHACALADIYREECAFQDAFEIYSRLLREYPDDEALQEKIKELEALAGREAAEPGAAPEPPFQLGVLSPYHEHIEEMTAHLERLQESGGKLSSGEARGAMDALDGLLNKIMEKASQTEGGEPHDQNTGS